MSGEHREIRITYRRRESTDSPEYTEEVVIHLSSEHAEIEVPTDHEVTVAQESVETAALKEAGELLDNKNRVRRPLRAAKAALAQLLEKTGWPIAVAFVKEELRRWRGE